MSWYIPDMTALPRDFPAYDLYGDANSPQREEFFHCETIKVRSQRYEWEISPHVHPQLSQVLFVASGQVDLLLDDKVWALSGPQLVFVPCGTVHGFRFSPDVVGYVVTVSQAFIESLPRQDALRMQMQRAAVHEPASPITRRLLLLGRELLMAERERFEPNVHQLHRALGEAWLRLAIQPAAAQVPGGETLGQKFQALVEMHYRLHRPLAFYAARLNCTERTLSRQVVAAFGMTPQQLINRRLVFEARRLLRFTNASCADVSAELGFEDPSYFSRFYLRLAGKRPSVEKGSAAASRGIPPAVPGAKAGQGLAKAAL